MGALTSISYAGSLLSSFEVMVRQLVYKTIPSLLGLIYCLRLQPHDVHSYTLGIVSQGLALIGLPHKVWSCPNLLHMKITFPSPLANSALSFYFLLRLSFSIYNYYYYLEKYGIFVLVLFIFGHILDHTFCFVLLLLGPKYFS